MSAESFSSFDARVRALGLWRARRAGDTLPGVYEYPPRRRLSPILIAVLALLAGVAGTSAYLLVGQYLGAQPRATSPSTSGTTTPAVATTRNIADPCPQFTVDAIKAKGKPGNLERVIYVEVALNGVKAAEAWICRDSDGVLYYQGHDFKGPATAATSDYTLLLGVTIQGSVYQVGSTFTATNPSTSGSTQYIVSRERLTLVLPGGARTDYVVVRTSP